MTRDRITVLHAHDERRLAKAFAVASNGQVGKRDYDSATWFSAETVPVADIHNLHRLLLALENDPFACVIRGGPAAETDLRRTRRTKKAFPEEPRHWVLLDADGIALPAGTSVLSDPEDAARAILQLLATHAPELEGVSAVVRFSSSAGLEEMAEAEETAGLPSRWRGVAKPGISAHIWLWLRQPLGEAEIKRWVAPLQAAGLKLDQATVRTVQPHYTAAPIFGAGLRDPLAGRRTVLVQGVEDAAELDIPPEPVRASYSDGDGGNTRTSRGYAAYLDEIGGPEGFREPIKRTIFSFVATSWPDGDFVALNDLHGSGVRLCGSAHP